jgi:hypothetical protein
MAFLAPWFLLGALAIAGPLVAHLRRLHVQKRVAFSAVDLLEPRPPRSARRSWEDLALMAARMAVLGLLSLAFARPYLPLGAPTAGVKSDEKRVVVLIDTSASMRRGRAFEEARRTVLEKMRAGAFPAALEVRAFDRGLRTVLPFTHWNQTVQADRETLLEQTLAALEPGWAVARLDEALRTVAEQHAAEGAGGSTEVLVVSDFQEGTGIAGLQGYEWPPLLSVTLCRVDSQCPAGVALRWLPPDVDTAPSDAPCRLQLATPQDFRAEAVKLRLDGAAQTQTSFAVVAGKSKVVSFPHPAAVSRVRVDGMEDIAAAVWVARVPQKRALVVVAGEPAAAFGSGAPPGAGAGEEKTAAAYFVRSALQALGEARVELAEAGTLPVGRDAEVALWVVCGGTGPALQERMRASIERGSTALVLLGSEAEAPALGALAGIPITARENKTEDGSFAVLGSIEREHPLFAPFLSPQFSDFTAIRFWRHRVLELPGESAARVLARFEGGDPAVLEVRRGQGRVLAWSSDWKPADGQWVLSSRCVPFLAACVELAGGGKRPLVTGSPGESFVLPDGTTGVRSETGERLAVAGGSVVPDQPGVYQIEPGGGMLVVNVAPEEATFAAIPDGKLEALGVPVNRQASPSAAAGDGTDGKGSLALSELESRQGAWRFVLGAVLGVLVLETIWAATITQRRKGIA